MGANAGSGFRRNRVPLTRSLRSHPLPVGEGLLSRTN
jgi:hypothetical protein